MLDHNIEYTISEASDITGYAPHVLRYYEKEFEIEIPRKDSNHRYYTYKEIELIQYIKGLKDKGFGNKQIKLIINSPETIMNHEDNSIEIVKEEDNTLVPSEIAIKISEVLEDRFFERLEEYLYLENQDTSDLISDLKEEIILLRNEINLKERDVLICENAKLKMKYQEQINENNKLKEELIRYKEQSIFKKIFGTKVK
ncbi:MerR family transcriptional regulator [Tissierella creatinophila]|uniref:MerR family regulatory protein n=1 Tax=Tissierella creatinophila DSM 6911 TaxID=1123403 RepID=A0A1U7M9G6_TISCR|nr:MerR family transcriptional regulator [Tissierella creatinophila]OLS03962.1 MerR family regulatory protein [Tissierella creatinophila DSM 6911]